MSHEEPDGTAPRLDPAEPAVPVCYRHPDRETHIRCGHCGRPVCPECMVSAAVGFQCPECVRESGQSVAAPRTILGAKVNQQAQRAQLTKVLIGINLVIFVLAKLGGAAFRARFEMIGRAGVAGPVVGHLGVSYGEWYRLLTAVFLHVEVWHIAVNMWSLWVLGRPLEAILGRLRFAGLYLVCGLAGSAVSYCFSTPGQESLGASGAIFGLAGAMVVIGRRLRYDLRLFLAILGLNLIAGFYYSGVIDWRAHLGGLVAGAALGLVFAYPPPRRRTAFQVGGLLTVVALVLVTVAVRTATLAT